VRADAVALARASATFAASQSSWPPSRAPRFVTSACAIDPFSVPLERKLDLLFRVDEALRRVKGVSITEGFLTFIRSASSTSARRARRSTDDHPIGGRLQRDRRLGQRSSEAELSPE